VTVAAGTCVAADAATTAVFGCAHADAAGILAAAGSGARIIHQS